MTSTKITNATAIPAILEISFTVLCVAVAVDTALPVMALSSPIRVRMALTASILLSSAIVTDHFEDIYALLKWTLEQETFEVVKQFDFTTDCQDAFLYVMGYIEQNSFFLNCIYDSLGRDQMKRFLYQDLVGIIDSVVRSAEQELSAPLPDNLRKFLTEFYTEGIAGMLINTFQENHALNRAELIECFSLIVRSSIPATIRQALIPHSS